MNKINSLEAFNKELEIELYFFTDIEIEQILDDYKDLFNEKKSSGKTEMEIIESFDSPKIIAKNYAYELDIKTSNIKKEIARIRKKGEKWLEEINFKMKSSEIDNAVSNDILKEEKKIVKVKYKIIIILKFLLGVLINLIKLLLYVNIILVVVIFFLSLLLIKINGPYTLILRALELGMVISYIGIIIIILSYMKKGKNE